MTKTGNILLFAVCLVVVAGFMAVRSEERKIAEPLAQIPLKAPVVVELFTSQGCSSCPPADAYLTQLAGRENIIALSCNVTYWDRLGWEDSLGHEFCDERQQAYSQAQGREGKVFTPEMIINGVESVVGNRGWTIPQAIKDADGRVIPLALNKGEDGKAVVLEVPAITIAQNHPSEILALFYGENKTVSIGRGENGGTQITYSNPVISIMSISKPWNGETISIKIPPYAMPKETAGVVVIVQRSQNDGAITPDGAILAAGHIRL